ncbi:MAG: hypothetical protein ACR2IK_10125, partial [Chloroflexota bacterium]
RHSARVRNGHVGSVLYQVVARLVCAARNDRAGRGSPAECFEIPYLVILAPRCRSQDLALPESPVYLIGVC